MANVIIPGPSGTNLVMVDLGGGNYALSTALATLVKIEGTWKSLSVPAVSTAPSASQASAGAALKNVCIGFSLNLVQIAAQASVMYFTLRDGATGAGTVLAQWAVPVGAVNSTWQYGLTGLYIPGTANTAMTLELTNQAGAVTAPTTNNFASVIMWGNTEA